MPYALASMPQMFVAVMQHVRAVENENMQFGASGGGGVQVPATLLPHSFVAAFAQHATGGVFDKPGLGGAGKQVAVPHVTGAAGLPAALAPVPAVVWVVPAAPVPAAPGAPPLPVAVVPAAGSVPPPPAAATAAGESLPQAAKMPNINPNQETRSFIFYSYFHPADRLGTPSTPLSPCA